MKHHCIRITFIFVTSGMIQKKPYTLIVTVAFPAASCIWRHGGWRGSWWASPTDSSDGSAVGSMKTRIHWHPERRKGWISQRCVREGMATKWRFVIWKQWATSVGKSIYKSWNIYIQRCNANAAHAHICFSMNICNIGAAISGQFLVCVLKLYIQWTPSNLSSLAGGSAGEAAGSPAAAAAGGRAAGHGVLPAAVALLVELEAAKDREKEGRHIIT